MNAPLWPLLMLLAAEPTPRPLMVILPPTVEARAQAPDTDAFQGTLQSELSSAARAADVVLLEDAAAKEAVTDAAVLRCKDVTCAAAVGTATKARFVIASEVAALGGERVVNIRLFDAESGRVVGMLTEKAGFEDETLPPVAARAALRLAQVAKVGDAPADAPPAPAPSPAPSPDAAPLAPPDATPPAPTIITVPVPGTEPAATPDAPPPAGPDATPTSPRREVTAAVDAPKPESKGPELPGILGQRRVGWGLRVVVALLGFPLGGWIPLLAPLMWLSAALLLLRAVELNRQLHARPHDRAEITQMRTQGIQVQVLAHLLGAGGLAFVAVGLTIPLITLAAALLLP